MFEKIRLIGELSELELKAGISNQQADELLYVARKTGQLKDAVEFSKGGVGPELGAAYLILCLCEMTAGTPGPRSLMEALQSLFQEAVISIQSFLDKPSRQYVPARTLHTMAMGVQLKMLSANGDITETSEGPDMKPNGSVEQASGAATQVNEMPFNPTMPDITSSKVDRAWDSETHTIVLVKNAKTFAEEAGMSGVPITYPLTLAIVEKGQSGPAFFVTLEKSTFGTECLCMFDKNGTHNNLGSGEEWKDENAFVRKGLEVIKCELGLTSEFLEMDRR